MKVLHLIPSYLPGNLALGPIQPTHFLNKELVKKGVAVTVYTTNRDGCKKLNVPINREVDIDGVKVFYFRSFGPSLSYFSWGFWRAIANTLGAFDVVHITSVFLAASTLGAYYARKFKKPYIISPHGSLMKEPLAKRSRFKKKVWISLLERRNLAGAAAIHFTVEAEKREYGEAGLPLKKSFVIPNGFDGSEFLKKLPSGFFRNKFNIPSEKKLVLFLGRISWKKGFDTLIPAFEKIVHAEPEALLVIAGRDDEGYRKKVEEWIIQRHLTDKVLFLGVALGDERLGAMKDSQVFVLPSYSENFAMTVVEAMFLGLPVVITKGVGVAPSVEKAGAGFVIEKNEEDLAVAVLEILHNQKLAQEMGERGKALVNAEFAKPAIADKFIGAYTEIIKSI